MHGIHELFHNERTYAHPFAGPRFHLSPMVVQA